MILMMVYFGMNNKEIREVYGTIYITPHIKNTQLTVFMAV